MPSEKTPLSLKTAPLFSFYSVNKDARGTLFTVAYTGNKELAEFPSIFFSIPSYGVSKTIGLYHTEAGQEVLSVEASSGLMRKYVRSVFSRPFENADMFFRYWGVDERSQS